MADTAVETIAGIAGIAAGGSSPAESMKSAEESTPPSTVVLAAPSHWVEPSPPAGDV